MKRSVLLGWVLLVVLGGPATVDAQATRNLNPTWSPNGSQLAFVSNREGNPEIYIVDATGANSLCLPHHIPF